MAPTPASIELNWISNYPVGCHRVCYGLDPGGPFTCFNVNCTPGVGVACSTSIPITVENESCDAVTYYGYIQACCETEGSMVGRIPWNVTFTPVPTCIAVEFLCNNLEVDSATITNAGSGYNPGAPPSAVISGGGGVGATATVVIGNGGISTTTISNAGAGMTNGTYPAAAANAITGVGTGATFNVTVAGGVITSITRVAFGTGYAIGDTVRFPSIPGSGTEVITINSVNTSQIQAITITAPGSGFSSTPIITIDPSPGFGGFAAINGTADLVLTVCPAFAAGSNCDTDVIGNTLAVTAGQSFQFCYPGGLTGAPVPPTEFSTSEEPLTCCFDCHAVTVTQPNTDDANVFYQNCATGAIVAILVPKGTAVGICARNNSYGSDQADTTFVVGLVCA